jgi:hypothetical protein
VFERSFLRCSRISFEVYVRYKVGPFYDSVFYNKICEMSELYSLAFRNRIGRKMRREISLCIIVECIVLGETLIVMQRRLLNLFCV